MTAEELQLLFNYIDAKIEYELASIIEDESGYRQSATKERKHMEELKQKLELKVKQNGK